MEKFIIGFMFASALYETNDGINTFSNVPHEVKMKCLCWVVIIFLIILGVSLYCHLGSGLKAPKPPVPRKNFNRKRK